MGCLHDPANVQQASSKCIQNTRANARRLRNRVNTRLVSDVEIYDNFRFEIFTFYTSKA